MTLKLGRKPALHNAHTMRSALRMAAALDTLGPPPATSTDWTAKVNAATGGSWGLHLNDQLGDCVIADSANAVMIVSANSGKIIIPTDAECQAAYTAVGGYDGVPGDASDAGLVEVEAMAYLRSTGLAGVKLEAYGSLDPRNLDHVKWSIELYGGVRFGFDLPQSAEEQFNAGQNLTYVPGSPSLGGHDMRGVRCAPGWIALLTWGRCVWASEEFVQRLADEAHGELYEGWSPAGVDHATLRADLARINDEMVAA